MGKRSEQEQPYDLPHEFVRGMVGIVTITYNSASVLSDFLISLEQQTYRKFILYAVDNASIDKSVEILRGNHDFEIRVIPNAQNVGVAAGNNEGIRAALADGCECVLLVNNDVVFPSSLLQGLLDGLADNNCDMTTPMMYFYEPSNLIWCAGGGFRRWLGYANYHRGGRVVDEGQFDKADLVTYAPTCCVLFRRDVFGRIGLMDERYFVYRDDTDFLFRAYRARLQMYFVPTVKLWHKVSSLTVRGSAFDLRYGTRNRALFLAKYFSRRICMLFTLLYFGFYGIQAVSRRITWQTFRLKREYWREGLNVVSDG